MTHNLKTSDIIRALRNRITPAVKLASWQNGGIYKPLQNNLSCIREELKKSWNASETLASMRRELIDQQESANGCIPEMSSPEAERPLLWLSKYSPLVNAWVKSESVLDHNGWYCDDVCQDVIFGIAVECIAVELRDYPGIFFEGTIQDEMDGSGCIDLNKPHYVDYTGCGSEWDRDDARQKARRQCIYSADQTARITANEEREYRSKESKENELAEMEETVVTLRKVICNLARELKPLCLAGKADSYPLIAQLLRNTLKSLNTKRKDALYQIANLRKELTLN